MTSKQILNAFSETLMRDERILSPRERELLMSSCAKCEGRIQQQSEIQSGRNCRHSPFRGGDCRATCFCVVGKQHRGADRGPRRKRRPG